MYCTPSNPARWAPRPKSNFLAVPNLVDTDSDGFSDSIEAASGSAANDGAGVPTILTPFDQTGVTGGGPGITMIDPASIAALLGQAADDFYTGTITYSGTIEFTELANGTGESGFAGIQIYQGNDEGIGVGDQWNDTNWSGYKAPDGTNLTLLNDADSAVPLAIDTPESLTVTIDMLAGADDTVTVTFRGKDAVFTGPVDFDQLRVRCGNGNQSANFTELSFQVGSGQPEEMPQITRITHDQATGTSIITWTSQLGTSCRIDYSFDLTNWDGESKDEVDSTGEMTSTDITILSLALPLDTPRIFYRVVPLEYGGVLE